MNLEELIQLVESGQHGVPFDAKLDEDELVKLADKKAGGMASDVSIHISPASVVVGAKTKMAAFAMDVRLEGKPVLDDGSLKFDVDHLDLNNRPAPDFMLSQISSTINERLNPDQLPVKLSHLELGEGWVKVAGETK